MKLADNYDMHKISEKFDNESDGTGDSRVHPLDYQKKKKKNKKNGHNHPCDQCSSIFVAFS